ncbi:TRAP transporter substrate-binding protein [Oryzomicrobium sp.]|uniref:TRAP transporter substrate-binding protein n=1 Tax=Oryzomicrobium sp. TaxID=1911578 RepID=UPI0025D8B2E2|nr:TRAP transporter substrate-binding protein [Oryzomicrobium sp.]MCE1243083.1 TRAP transporter substrate-binding protein [Oryzomicrobium sp.]
MTSKNRNLFAAALAACAVLTAPAAALAQTVNAKFSVTLPEKSHQGQGAARFAELVKEKTQGRVQIKVYYNASLGNDVQVTSALQGGTIEFVVPQTSTLTGMIKDFEVLDFPFLFDNEKEADAVLDGPIGQKLLDKLPAKGLVGLAYWENGFFNATTSKHPIARLEDFAGLKFRAVQAPISLETLKALGANPVPLAVPEVYSALETRTIDGQATPTAVIAALKFNEVQKYLSITKLSYGAFLPLVSKKFWDKLSPDDQKALRDAAVEARAFQRQVARDAARSAQEDMARKGMTVNVVAPAEIARMRAQVRPVWDKFAKEAGPDLVKDVIAEIDKQRRK